MTRQTLTYDPVVYKTTSREEWDAAAVSWYRWSAALELWLGEATELMLKAAGVETGMRVLDVAAGAGGQTIPAARRVGPTGIVLATDTSPIMLNYAEIAARDADLTNVETLAIDAEEIDLAPNSFDAAISRLGLSYLVEPAAALQGVHRTLRPGARFSTIVFASAIKNTFLLLPFSILRLRGKVPPPLAGTPGPFRLGFSDMLRAEFVRAGFRDVVIREVESPLDLPTGRMCALFLRETHRDLDTLLNWLPPNERDEAWEEVRTALTRLEKKGGGFEGDCRLLVASGLK